MKSLTTKDKLVELHRDQCVCRSCGKRNNIEVNINEKQPSWSCFYCQTKQPWVKSQTYKKRVNA